MKKKSKKKVSVVNHGYSATDIKPKRDEIMPRISRIDQSIQFFPNFENKSTQKSLIKSQNFEKSTQTS